MLSGQVAVIRRITSGSRDGPCTMAIWHGGPTRPPRPLSSLRYWRVSHPVDALPQSSLRMEIVFLIRMEGSSMSHGSERRPMTNEVWHRADLLDQLIARLGVAGVAMRLERGEALLAAHDRCLDCLSPTACDRLLADLAVTELIPPACPNAVFLERCMAIAGCRHC